MSRKIELTSPIAGVRGQSIKSITLREPRYRDFIDLGYPVTWVATEGGGFEQETSELIGSWIERLADIDPNFLESLNLRDTLALRGAVLGFFREAQAPAVETPSSASGAASSSDSDSIIGPSRI